MNTWYFVHMHRVFLCTSVYIYVCVLRERERDRLTCQIGVVASKTLEEEREATGDGGRIFLKVCFDGDTASMGWRINASNYEHYSMMP